jgi:CRP/FNR family cyclic AMP-dependent transcriptional regulator
VKTPLLFFGVDTAEVQAVLAAARTRTFERGDIVFHQGDPGDSLQVISRGHFALRIITPQGDLHISRVYGPGDVFGRLAVASIEAVRDMTVVCMDGGATFELFRNQVDDLRSAHPSVNDALVAMAGVELRRAAQLLLEALYMDADRRVRRRLLELGEQFHDDGDTDPVIPLSQEEIAAIAGTSRATVSRVLSEEERRGTIARRRRRIVLLDVEELARWARWPGDARDQRELSRM